MMTKLRGEGSSLQKLNDFTGHASGSAIVDVFYNKPIARDIGALILKNSKIFNHVHDLIHLLPTSDGDKFKETLRDLSIQCSSLRENVIKKFLCVLVLQAIGIVNVNNNDEKAIMEAGTTELCSLFEMKSGNEENQISIEMILVWTFGIPHQLRYRNKASEELICKSRICSANKITTSAMKGGIMSEQLFNISDDVNKLSKEEDNEIARLGFSFNHA
ncbi:MAG: hypothetical protein EZS28_027427 [Streblomastix strix]|uniref:Uncharacterized protein n=1 Tax=Streblomastix strix TaxID=222440 RepID=A0A5J4V277_9EUKA|nr:MAG: hypothetical protein EZS28_027427 [Streblomastix strix]